MLGTWQHANVTGLGDLGALGCKELNLVVDALGAALHEADRAGVSTDTPAYVAALAFYERETGFFSETWVVGSESCKNLVDQGNALIVQLNSAIASVGGAQAPTVNSTLAPPEDTLGTIKSVAIAASIIAAAFMLVPVVTTVATAIKTGRKR